MYESCRLHRRRLDCLERFLLDACPALLEQLDFNQRFTGGFAAKVHVEPREEHGTESREDDGEDEREESTLAAKGLQATAFDGCAIRKPKVSKRTPRAVNNRRVNHGRGPGGVHRAVLIGPRAVQIEDGALNDDGDAATHNAHDRTELGRCDDEGVDVFADETEVERRRGERAHQVNHQKERQDVNLIDGDENGTDIQRSANYSHRVCWKIVVQDVTV